VNPAPNDPGDYVGFERVYFGVQVRQEAHGTARDGRRDEIQIAVSPAILDETCRVLRDKFHFSEARIAETRALIEACTVLVHPKARLNVITEDSDDDRILECAVESGSDTIVPGTKTCSAGVGIRTSGSCRLRSFWRQG
jgi:hypothetical protein